MNALLAPRPRGYQTPLGFIVIALLFYAIDGTLVHSPIFLEKPDVLAAAVSVDLTFGITAAWWIMVVRRGNAPRRTILPVFLFSILAAMLTLPAGHRDLLPYFRYLAIPFELAVFAAIFIGVRQTNRRLAAAGAELDVPERIRAATGDSVYGRVADVLATEGSLFYYALASWRRRPFVPRNAAAFTYHVRTGRAGLIYAAAAISLIETAAVDFLLRVHHRGISNALLALGIFGVVWLVGFARAMQLRPTFVTRDRLSIRLGLQWSIDIERGNVRDLRVGGIKPLPKKSAEYLRLGSAPNVSLALGAPVEAHGPYGMRRSVSRIDFVVDDAKRLQQVLAVPGDQLL